ncbi:Uncharacterised protein [Vibrio cholerae]|nr:Uncharacterised protein [Vibrio cholerae]
MVLSSHQNLAADRFHERSNWCGIGVIAVSINRFAQCHRDTT